MAANEDQRIRTADTGHRLKMADTGDKSNLRPSVLEIDSVCVRMCVQDRLRSLQFGSIRPVSRRVALQGNSVPRSLLQYVLADS
jgi:hypothetical protein